MSNACGVSWAQIRNCRRDIFTAHLLVCIFQARQIKNYLVFRFRFILQGGKLYAVMSSLTALSQHLCSWHSCALSEMQGKLPAQKSLILWLLCQWWLTSALTCSLLMSLGHSIHLSACIVMPEQLCIFAHTRIRISWLFRRLCDPQEHHGAYMFAGLGSY